MKLHRRTMLKGTLGSLTASFMLPDDGEAGIAASDQNLAPIRISEIDAQGFAARWAGALRAHRTQGRGRSIVIDYDAVADGVLEAVGRSNSGLTVRGATDSVRVTASTPGRVLFLIEEQARGIVFESLILDGENRIDGALIDSYGLNCRFQNLKLSGSTQDGYCAGVAVAGSHSIVRDCAFSDLAMGVRLRSISRPISRVEVKDCSFAHIGRRGVSIASGGPPVMRVRVENVRIDAPAKACQPVRVDAAKGPVRQIRLLNGTIFDEVTESNGDDALSINSGVASFSISGWAITRHSDVGINVSGGCRDGTIINNKISGPDFGVNIGALRDAGARNRRVEVTGNHLSKCRRGYFRIFQSDKISIHDNTVDAGDAPDVPVLEFRNSREMSLFANRATMDLANVNADVPPERSSFRRVEGMFAAPPVMAAGAKAGESRITLSGSRQVLMWRGKAFSE